MKVEINEFEVHLKKGMFGYRVIHPHKNPDGTYNWMNILIGGWGNFFKLLFIMFVLLSFFYGVKEMTASCRDMAENPCVYFDLDCSRTDNSAFLRDDFKQGQTQEQLSEVGDFNERS